VSRFWFVMAAGLALLGVAGEAFGSHALREVIGAERWATYQTGSRNHMYHALGLFAVGVARQHGQARLADAAGWLLVAGIALFSGPLYVVAVTGVEALRALPGIGGTAFLAGWGALILSVLRRSAPRSDPR
jgi:uncharacterized membrane protein YgdD (TMEM256/DUF423 family)